MTEETPPQEEPIEAAQDADDSPSRQDRYVAGIDDNDDDTPDVGHGFSVSVPLRWAIHGALYYAGRSADRIVSLYNSTFRLDKRQVADFNKSTGIAYAKGGHWERAIPLLEKALSITPDDQEVLMHLAEAYGATDQDDKACQHLEQVLEMSPNSARAVRALGIIHSRRQDYDHALEFLEKAVQLDPDDAQVYYRLGIVYDNKKLYDQAVTAFEKAVLVDPRFAKAYQALGFVHESMGDRESAVGCFKKALELE